MQKSIQAFTNHDAAIDDPFTATAEEVSAYLRNYEVANESKDIQIIPQVTEIVLDGVVSTRYTVTVVVTW